MIETMTMTPDEKRRFEKLEEEVEDIRDKQTEIDRKLDRILVMLKGIAIGIAIGGLIFGVFTFKDLFSIVK